MSGSLDADELLTIDVEAEIRKLGRAPVDGPEQIPAELARRALRAGARQVDVELGRRTVTLRDDGAALPRESLAALAALLDRSRPAHERHTALLALERGADAALLALCSARSVRVDSAPARGPGLRLSSGLGQPARLSAASAAAGTRYELAGLRLDARGVRRWLTAVCRFARTQVVLDGARLPSGFDAPLAETALVAPLEGRIAVPELGDEPRLWLLMHGAVVAHLSIPGQPLFEAAIEMRGLAPQDAAPAALREAIRPLEGELLRQLCALLARAAASLPQRPEPVQRRLRLALLRALRAGADELAWLPVIPGLDGPGAAPRWFSLADLRAAATSQPLCALFPEQSARAFRLPPGPTFVLDARERGLLATLCDARFAAPQRRSEPSLRLRFAATVDALRGAARRACERLPAPGIAPLDESELGASERALLRALATVEELPPAAYVERGGSVFVRGGRLWLPRGSALVRAAAAALDGPGGSWRYPALLALLGERAAPLRLRGDWTPPRVRDVLDRLRRSAYSAHGRSGKVRTSRNLRGDGRSGTEDEAP